MADIRDLLNLFNEGELDIDKYFGGDYQVFFNLLKKRGLMGDIDPVNGLESGSWQNEYLLWCYENDLQKYYYWIGILLNDIVISGNTAIWQGDREDLADLFCDGRDISRSTIKEFLNGEDILEPYWDTTDDVHRDVIEELSKKNYDIFRERVLKLLNGKKLSPETFEMEQIATEQGHTDFWELTPENCDRIIKDSESMTSLLNDELSDIKSDLYSIHSYAYNSAYESEFYKKVYNELDEYFFSDEGKYISEKHPFKQNTMIEKYQLPIRNFENLINDVLDSNRKYKQNTLEYEGSFLRILVNETECLSFYTPDYADPSEVDRNINMYFSDYF